MFALDIVYCSNTPITGFSFMHMQVRGDTGSNLTAL